jgi:predicted nucleic acid-binding protein
MEKAWSRGTFIGYNGRNLYCLASLSPSWDVNDEILEFTGDLRSRQPSSFLRVVTMRGGHSRCHHAFPMGAAARQTRVMWRPGPLGPLAAVHSAGMEALGFHRTPWPWRSCKRSESGRRNEEKPIQAERRNSFAKHVRGGSMATSSPTSPPCLTIDSNILIAICSKEVGRHTLADAELTSYAMRGYEFYAPGYIVGECLYVLCRKLEVDRSITPAEHAVAVADLSTYMKMILPPPNGEASLVTRAEEIRGGFGCSRSADGLFIALAEELTASRTTELLTFDAGIPSQTRRHAPTVAVRVLPTVVGSAVATPPATAFPSTPPSP